jgi:hypothetical protein
MKKLLLLLILIPNLAMSDVIDLSCRAEIEEVRCTASGSCTTKNNSQLASLTIYIKEPDYLAIEFSASSLPQGWGSEIVMESESANISKQKLSLNARAMGGGNMYSDSMEIDRTTGRLLINRKVDIPKTGNITFKIFSLCEKIENSKQKF